MSKSKSPVIVAVFLATWFLSSAAFIALKSFGVISWSWWWLLVPALGTPTLAILAVGLVAVCAIFITLSPKNKKL